MGDPPNPNTNRRTGGGLPRFLAVVGPTAVGKTGLSLQVGARMEVEIVSMDSRQVYRGMDIGTGKVSLRDRARLRHHGLDLRHPNERYSAGQFARDARGWIRDIQARGRVPLLVGGTGFFLRALMEPLFSEPPLDRERRERLRCYLKGLEVEELGAWVRRLDPQRERAASEGGRHRLTRTVEMALLTGRSLSWWHARTEVSAEPLTGIVVLMGLPRPLLNERIDRRVDEMVRGGLVEEVKELLEAGYRSSDPGLTGAGYREVVQYLQGESGLVEAVDAICRSHRRYARRQSTWYRNQLPPGVLVLDGRRELESLAEEVVAVWREADRRGRMIP